MLLSAVQRLYKLSTLLTPPSRLSGDATTGEGRTVIFHPLSYMTEFATHHTNEKKGASFF